MKTTVIYHSADYDGIFCREIAKKFLPDAELVGWNFGEPKIILPWENTVYVMDLSPECLSYVDGTKIVWIDHHKTSIEKWPKDIPGYRIDGVAACRLAWQWFTAPKVADIGVLARDTLPNKEQFIDRKLSEPIAVRLAGEYDVWCKEDPRAETFQYSLRLGEPNWKVLLDVNHPDNYGLVCKMLIEGDAAQRYAQNVDASICKHRTWLMDWEGLKFLCVNSARFNSLFFAAKDVPETGHDALLGFCFDGKCWTVSLYHAKHRTDLDLSEIAKKHGGGGHKGACGFTIKELPFTL